MQKWESDAFKRATFAGGCFWCMVKPFDTLPGIVSVQSGYTGGHTDNPTYEDVGTEQTGHYEAVQIVYDPARFPYTRLLDVFWGQIDPTDDGGQFGDRGASYRSAIFVHDEQQRREAEASKRALEKSGRFKRPIVTAILPAQPFYIAEEEHQDYYKRRIMHYRRYREASGRDAYLARHWQTERDMDMWRKSLGEAQYRVIAVREEEAPYANAYWNQNEPGIYVDVLTGDPLFGTADQYDASTGYPAFTRPLEEGLVVREAELHPEGARTAVRSRLSGAWLGHLLTDGPGGDKRHYHIQSAALRFVPLTRMEAEGYARYSDRTR
nr:peptide-methionine (S)-S-oxide reductase MsrA [Paenibacillus sabuli]